MIKKKLLLVDDTEEMLDLLEIAFYQQFEIYTASNGAIGVDQAVKIVPDCIITDIMMPVMDGIRFFNSLRREKVTENIPVIAVTTFEKKMSRKSLKNIGFCEVVSKPLELKKVIDVVNEILYDNKHK